MDKSERFEIRLTYEEKCQLIKDAYRHNMRPSEYLRFLIRLGSVLKTKKEEKK